MWNNPQATDHLQAVTEGRIQNDLQTFLFAEDQSRALSNIRQKDAMLYEWLLSYTERSGLLAKTDVIRHKIDDYFVNKKDYRLSQLTTGMAEAAGAILWLLNNKEAIDQASQKVRIYGS